MRSVLLEVIRPLSHLGKCSSLLLWPALFRWTVVIVCQRWSASDGRSSRAREVGSSLCALPGGHARLLWLLPVTASEIAFRRKHGTEALEQLFDEAEINPVDPRRPAVLPHRDQTMMSCLG
ncbi:suppressor of fused domain protein [Streptomyces sp. NPDC001070]